MIVLTLKHSEDLRSLMNNWDYKVIPFKNFKESNKVQIIPLYTYSVEDVARDLCIYGTVEQIKPAICISAWSFPRDNN